MGCMWLGGLWCGWVGLGLVFYRPMRKHTKPGDICFEPFSGSGSQLIAAEQLGRRCFAMELEPTFVEVAVRRWEAFTGRKGERVPSAAPAPTAAPSGPAADPTTAPKRNTPAKAGSVKVWLWMRGVWWPRPCNKR